MAASSPASFGRRRPRGGQLPLMTPPTSIVGAVGLMYAGALTSLLLAATILAYRIPLVFDGGFRLRRSLAHLPEVVNANTPEGLASLGVRLGVIALVVLAGIWVVLAHATGRGRPGTRAWATGLGALNLLLAMCRLVQQGFAYPANALAWLLTAGITVTILVLIWREDATDYFDDRHRQVYPPPETTR